MKNVLNELNIAAFSKYKVLFLTDIFSSGLLRKNNVSNLNIQMGIDVLTRKKTLPITASRFCGYLH